MIFGGERIEAFDHITLEFPSEKTHVTAYGTDGQPVHIAQAWRTYRHPDHSLRYGFLCWSASRFSAIRIWLSNGV